MVDFSYLQICRYTSRLLLCSLKKNVRFSGSISRTNLSFSPIRIFSDSLRSFNHISRRFLRSLSDNTTPITLESSNSSPMQANKSDSHFLLSIYQSRRLKWMIQVPPSMKSSHMGLLPLRNIIILLSISIFIKVMRYFTRPLEETIVTEETLHCIELS